MASMRFGVSPAYLLSLYGDRFTPDQVCEGIAMLPELGFVGYQAEIVHADMRDLWLNGGAKRVRQAAVRSGLRMNQMVAHFMLDGFGSLEALESDFELLCVEDVMRISDQLEDSDQITVPIGPFAGERNECNHDKLANKLRRIAERMHRGGYRMALEVQPNALISGGHAIYRLAEEAGFHTGYNFDTGHAWAAGNADVAEFPRILGDRIRGTHLCDNDGIVNDSLRPGAGSIDWVKLAKNLADSAYAGSWDLEIFCAAADVRTEYSAGLAFLREQLMR